MLPRVVRSAFRIASSFAVCVQGVGTRTASRSPSPRWRKPSASTSPTHRSSTAHSASTKPPTICHQPPTASLLHILTNIFFDQPPQTTQPTTNHIPLLVDELGIVLRRRAACLRAAQARSAGPTVIESLHQDPSKRCQLGGESGAGGADGAGGGGAADQPEEDTASGEQRKCCRS